MTTRRQSPAHHKLITNRLLSGSARSITLFRASKGARLIVINGGGSEVGWEEVMAAAVKWRVWEEVMAAAVQWRGRR